MLHETVIHETLYATLLLLHMRMGSGNETGEGLGDIAKFIVCVCTCVLCPHNCCYECGSV